MLPHHQGGEEEQRRFQIEAETIAQIQHPNIVQIYEVGEHEGCAYFSLEFCPGGSLDHYLSKMVLSHHQVASVIRDIASAVQAAHEANILHRDLKPANVLLTPKSLTAWNKIPSHSNEKKEYPLESFLVKVTDFGTAKKLDVEPNTLTGMIIGTPAYLSPEQAQALELGFTSDVYALGAVLYELLTGLPPFRGVTTYETVSQIIHNEPVPPRHISPEIPIDLETICLKCLNKETASRYVSAQALVDDLSNYLSGRPIIARPISPPQRAWRWCKRNPVVACLLTSIVSCIYRWHPRSQPLLGCGQKLI